MMASFVKTRESLANDIWRACDILRRDNNCGGVMEYVEHVAARWATVGDVAWANDAIPAWAALGADVGGLLDGGRLGPLQGRD